jgi:hypothetical protein
MARADSNNTTRQFASLAEAEAFLKSHDAGRSLCRRSSAVRYAKQCHVFQSEVRDSLRCAR